MNKKSFSFLCIYMLLFCACQPAEPDWPLDFKFIGIGRNLVMEAGNCIYNSLKNGRPELWTDDSTGYTVHCSSESGGQMLFNGEKTVRAAKDHGLFKLNYAKMSTSFSAQVERLDEFDLFAFTAMDFRIDYCEDNDLSAVVLSDSRVNCRAEGMLSGSFSLLIFDGTEERYHYDFILEDGVVINFEL